MEIKKSASINAGLLAIVFVMPLIANAANMSVTDCSTWSWSGSAHWANATYTAPTEGYPIAALYTDGVFQSPKLSFATFDNNVAKSKISLVGQKIAYEVQGISISLSSGWAIKLTMSGSDFSADKVVINSRSMQYTTKIGTLSSTEPIAVPAATGTSIALNSGSPTKTISAGNANKTAAFSSNDKNALWDTVDKNGLGSSLTSLALSTTSVYDTNGAVTYTNASGDRPDISIDNASVWISSITYTFAGIDRNLHVVTPEPTCTALLCVGFAAFFLRRKHRKA